MVQNPARGLAATAFRARCSSGTSARQCLQLRGQMGLICNELGQLKFSAELVQLGGNREDATSALINLTNFAQPLFVLYQLFVFKQYFRPLAKIEKL